MGSAGQITDGLGVDASVYNRLVIGSSVMTHYERSGSIPSQPAVRQNFKDHISTVMQQKRCNWDDVAACYINPWHALQGRRLSELNLPFDGVERKDGLLDAGRCFRLVWVPTKTASSRRWTADALNVGDDVLGFLTLALPTPACVGVHTACDVQRVVQETLNTTESQNSGLHSDEDETNFVPTAETNDIGLICRKNFDF